MAQVDCEVDLVMFRDIKYVFLVLHVNRHKLIANFRCMLGIVNHAELLVGHVIFHFWIVFQFDALTFDLLAPTVFVKALSEEDNVGENDLVVVLVDSIAHSVQIESKNFIYQHFLAIIVCQKIVVSLPFRLALCCNLVHDIELWRKCLH